MSIPDKFGRIVKHKMGELKDWFDQVDEEREARAEADAIRKRTTTDARQELEEAMTAPPSTPPNQKQKQPDVPTSGPLPRRTPEEISRGLSAGSTRSATSGGTMNAVAPDPLDYHYRLLGLEPGADFAAVQSAYNKLAARCEPARFPAGSPEESQAREIRKRLDASYKALRDVLDTTARRFDLLEFDTPAPPAGIDAKQDAATTTNGHLEI